MLAVRHSGSWISAGVAALVVGLSGSPATGQSVSSGRVEAIERQMSALQADLTRLKQEMAWQSGELKRSRDGARQVRVAAAQLREKANPAVTVGSDGSFSLGGTSLKLGGYIEAAGFFARGTGLPT
jgi:hypothetical protein